MGRSYAHEAAWPAERVALLRKHFANGLTQEQSADLLGTSPCAIAGKRHRLGLSRGRPQAKPMRSRKFAKVKPVEKPAPVEPLNIPFLETKFGQCRAITDDTRYEQKCCGQPCGESVYCAAHHALHHTASHGKAR